MDLAAAIESSFEKEREYLRQTKERNRYPDPPVSLHHTSGQSVIRTNCWRSIELLAWVFREHEEYVDTMSEEALESRNLRLVEVFRSVIQLMLFAGVSPRLLSSREFPQQRRLEGSHYSCWEYAYFLGEATRFLNEPKSPIPTNEPLFRKTMAEVFRAHLQVWSNFGLEEEDLCRYVSEYQI